MSEAEKPRSDDRGVTVEDILALSGASTPHFAYQLRNRITKLIAPLSPDHPARVLGEREIARLERLGLVGETRGVPGHGEPPLPSLVGGPVPGDRDE